MKKKEGSLKTKGEVTCARSVKRKKEKRGTTDRRVKGGSYLSGRTTEENAQAACMGGEKKKPQKKE